MKGIRPGVAGLVVMTALAGGATAQTKPKPAAPPPPQAQPQGAPPGADVLFPCRTAKETCFIGAVKDGKLAVLYSNDPKAQDVGANLLAVSAGDGGSPLDLSANEGKVVMIVGSYDPKAGLTKAEVVDVAGPLLGFAIKAGSGGGDAPSGPPSPPSRKR